MTVLVIKNDGIGDLILVSGLIAAISEYFNESIDLITCQPNKEIAENLYGVRNIFYVSRKKLRYNPYLSRLGIYLFPYISKEDGKVLNQIKEYKYDYAICLRRFIRSNSLFVMNNIIAGYKVCMWRYPVNVSMKIANKYSIGWHNINGDNSLRNELEYYQSVLKKILKCNVDIKPRLKLTDGIKHNKETKNIGICIGGPKGNWPIHYWIQLVNLLQRDRMKVYIFGGKDSIKNGQLIDKYCKGCINYVNKISFTDSIHILKNMSVLIGNETGFTHFASLILNKVLIIYGGRTFQRFFPWPGFKNQYIIYYGLDCFDCNNRCKYFLKKYKCLRLIPPIAVYKFFNEIMQKDLAENYRNLNPNTVIYKSYGNERSYKISSDNS